MNVLLRSVTECLWNNCLGGLGMNDQTDEHILMTVGDIPKIKNCFAKDNVYVKMIIRPKE